MAGYVQHKHGQLFKKQQGNILVMFTIALFALIAMAALAIDGGHMLLHKTRLQNIADAAALHAAKTLDEGGSHQEARAAAIEIIQLNLAHSDNHEINDALDLSTFDTLATQVTANINVDFSMQPDPFDSLPYDEDARYVKVEIRNLNLNNFLADILNFSKRVSATALAGATPAVEDCPANILPLVLCADDVSGGYPYGLSDPDNLFVLKIGSNTESPIGPGNFQLLDLPGDTLKEQLAGGFENDECYVSADTLDDIDTKPGNTASVSKAMNTRFGIYKGEFSDASKYPGDWNTCQGEELVEIYIDKDVTKDNQIDNTDPEDIVTEEMSGTIIDSTRDNAYRYSQYYDDIDKGYCSTGTGDIDEDIIGGSERRIFNIVVAQCEEGSNGKTTFPEGSWDVGCFFLTQQMITDGTGQDVYIIGELIEDCSGKGLTNGIAEDNVGPHKIVLYHVPGSEDS